MARAGFRRRFLAAGAAGAAGAAAVAAVALLIGYQVRKATAEGAPSVNPLWFTGTVTGTGVPPDGSVNIGLTLCNSPSELSRCDGLPVCDTPARSILVSAQRFRLPLDPSCREFVQDNRDLWAEVTVDGTTLAPFKLGAVPYAIEADHAVEATHADEAAQAVELVPAAAAMLAPAGAIVAYGGTTAPTGWHICDGSEVQRTGETAALFGAIGTAYGAGDGAATFNLPDLRGYFLRGVDSGSGNDPDALSRTGMALGGATGDAVGSVQDDVFESHRHRLGGDTLGRYYGGFAGGAPGDSRSAFDPTDETPTYPEVFTSADGGRETRPINAYVNFIIKY